MRPFVRVKMLNPRIGTIAGIPYGKRTEKGDVFSPSVSHLAPSVRLKPNSRRSQLQLSENNARVAPGLPVRRYESARGRSVC